MNIDEAINQVETLYQQVTGLPVAKEGEVRYPLNPNIDPISMLEAKINELLMMMQDPQVAEKLQPWTPAASIWESEDKILIRTDLPAVSKEDVDISVRGNLLVISGTRKNHAELAGFLPRLIENQFGPFVKTIALPIDNITTDIDSQLINGVLEITVPKKVVRENTSGKKGKSIQ